MSAASAAVLAGSFARAHPQEASRVIEGLSPETVADFLQRIGGREAARLLEQLSPAAAVQALESMEGAPASSLIREIDLLRATGLFARMEETPRQRLLRLIPASLARDIRFLLSYPEDSAGSLMEPRAVAFPEDTKVKDVLMHLRPARFGRVDDIFILDEEGKLTGSVALQDLAASPPGTALAEIAKRGPVSIQALAPRSEVLELFEKLKLTSLPVVDSESRLLGVIPNEELVTASAEEVSADIQTMVGVSPEERVMSKPGFAIRKRLPWLLINLGTAFIAAFVVGIFEKTIAQLTALAVLLPVVAGQSGNTGAQTLAVLMRGLALREIRPSQWARSALKEVSVAFFNGIVIGCVTAAGVYLWSDSAGLAGVIGLAMVISMLAAAVSGVAIPLGLAAWGRDPAQASSILLTTVTDVVGFLSFLGLATLMLGLL